MAHHICLAIRNAVEIIWRSPGDWGAPFPQDTALPIARISVFDNQDQNRELASTVIWQFTVFFLIIRYLAEKFYNI